VVYEILNWEEAKNPVGFKYHHEILDFLENQGFWVTAVKDLPVNNEDEGLKIFKEILHKRR
jgi:NAD-dependent DNA ligase